LGRRDLPASGRPGRVCEGTKVKVKAEVEKKKIRKGEGKYVRRTPSEKYD